MPTRLAINGFGRIGRNVLRALHESGRDDLEVVAINDLMPLETNAALLENDTVHGAFPGDITRGDASLDIGRGPIAIFAERDPTALPWGDVKVDIVLECTGVFRDVPGASKHLEAGAKRVLISAPGRGVERTVVYGINESEIIVSDTIVSNASCTTNCLSPIAKVLDDAFGLKRGFVTTIHSYTASQRLLDSGHKDARRARAAAENIIPTTTGAARAVGLVLPKLVGKLDGTAIRVPTPNVSAIDFTFESETNLTPDAIETAVVAAANGPMGAVLGVSNKPLVSRDFNHNPLSCVFDTHETRVLDGTMGRVLCWYDNEWGFSNRMLDVAAVMGKLS
ncbi:type I glyceraldehyde-3-phosphate dehydrogenase [Roseovarius rhodophyticola]|uniref:Glyceraldehyde-3-phosphate dehydrogenase n=1 Tax=Roseovarius rhodophyticola TaxID=3080827 RepID=A0ABZ2TEK4_9RHOB|nr:type I glyceraldehyde-3-phosphate dehydrogenase [Roseovarius sp. W115]MDV2928365.1 type I glyceraldehyde-3-phosphate dehydrogenase [Roseovarius sp. W115]